jgi:hypothetical protein
MRAKPMLICIETELRKQKLWKHQYSSGKSTFIIVRPESEDYPSLFKLSEEKARVVDGTPIMDLHLTVQAIRNVDDFDALKKRLEEYAATLCPFEIKAGNIARMNVNNQQGRLWLLGGKKHIP